MTDRILFICSNGTHVLTFTPVADELEKRGAQAILLSLDAYYGQGAETTAARTGEPIVRWRRPGGDLAPGTFYDRSTLMVWRDVLSARDAVRANLLSLAPTVVVLGNDFGLLEKLVLQCAKSLRIKCVLIQDGRLAAVTRRTPIGPMERVGRRAREVVSLLLRAAGFSYLGISDYGEGGAHVICASGPAGFQILLKRANHRSRVVVTGQPRYDRLARRVRATVPGPELRVAIFTTPFEAAGLDAGSQRRQQAMVVWLAEEVTRLQGHLMLKPHPRESPQIYAALPHTEILSEQTDPATLLEQMDIAVIGVSSLIEEAGLLLTPVIVPGYVVHSQRFTSRLPDPEIYPRFESREDARRLLTRLLPAPARVALAGLQRARVSHEITYSTTSASAVAVADVIMGS